MLDKCEKFPNGFGDGRGRGGSAPPGRLRRPQITIQQINLFDRLVDLADGLHRFIQVIYCSGVDFFQDDLPEYFIQIANTMYGFSQVGHTDYFWLCLVLGLCGQDNRRHLVFAIEPRFVKGGFRDLVIQFTFPHWCATAIDEIGNRGQRIGRCGGVVVVRFRLYGINDIQLFQSMARQQYTCIRGVKQGYRDTSD